MPEKEVIERARKDAEEGKSPSTQAGEFVREEIKHVREGKHGAKSAKQAIAIGLSKARRAGVKLPAGPGSSSETRRKAARDVAKGQQRARPRPSRKRSRAVSRALERAGRAAVSQKALSQQASASARKRGAAARSAAARNAVRTKGPRKRSQAAKKAARTRAARRT